MNNIDWQPTAEIKMLKKRAAYIEKIRAFFKERNVLEVETPLLSKYAVTDPYVNAISATNQYGKKYLQTSPEYFMKRLLAAGAGSIYQICKAFRDDPIGAKHNPEFTMLEWYQEGYDHFVLMEEIYDLIKTLQPDLVSISRSYAEIFDEYLGINPHTIKQKDLAKVVVNNIGQIQGLEEPNRTECLDLLFTHMIEPELEKFEELVFIYHYPAEQAALAQTDFDDGVMIAKRFEVFFKGFEIANGYNELLNPKILNERFNDDNRIRQSLKKDIMGLDKPFIQAHVHGLRPCSGVALGLDRLFMSLEKKNDISKVISFR